MTRRVIQILYWSIRTDLPSNILGNDHTCMINDVNYSKYKKNRWNRYFIQANIWIIITIYRVSEIVIAKVNHYRKGNNNTNSRKNVYWHFIPYTLTVTSVCWIVIFALFIKLRKTLFIVCCLWHVIFTTNNLLQI